MLKEKLVIYEICEECHGNGFTKCTRFSDKEVDNRYMCNTGGCSGTAEKSSSK